MSLLKCALLQATEEWNDSTTKGAIPDKGENLAAAALKLLSSIEDAYALMPGPGTEVALETLRRDFPVWLEKYETWENNSGSFPKGRISRVSEDLCAPGSKVIDWLRENGRYLAPNGSGDLMDAFTQQLRSWVIVMGVMGFIAIAIFLGFEFVGLGLENLAKAGWITQSVPPLAAGLPDSGYPIGWSQWFRILWIFLLALAASGFAWLATLGNKKEHCRPICILLLSVVVIVGALVWRMFGSAWDLETVMNSRINVCLALWTVSVLAGIGLCKMWECSVTGSKGWDLPTGIGKKDFYDQVDFDRKLRNLSNRWIAGFGLVWGILIAFSLLDTAGQTLYLAASQRPGRGNIYWAGLATAAGLALLWGKRAHSILELLPGQRRIQVPFDTLATVVALGVLLLQSVAFSYTAHGIKWLWKPVLLLSHNLSFERSEVPHISSMIAQLNQVAALANSPKPRRQKRSVAPRQPMVSLGQNSAGGDSKASEPCDIMELLWSRISDSGKKILTNSAFTQDDKTVRLFAELNRLIETEILFDEGDFRAVLLPKETRSLLLNPDKDLKRLNRQLFHAACPSNFVAPKIEFEYPQYTTPIAKFLCFGLGLSVFATFCFGRLESLVNATSLQYTYGSGLSRAYLGASNLRRHFSEGFAVTSTMRDDDLRWADYAPHKSGGPLHIVNICVNETCGGKSQIEQRDRRGFGLAIGPTGISAGAGSHALFNPSAPGVMSFRAAGESSEEKFHLFAGPQGAMAAPEIMTVGHWLAVSGAAFVTGLGGQTTFGKSLLQGLANVRLGYWWNSGMDPDARANRAKFSWWESLEALFARILPVYSRIYDEWFARFHGPGRRSWYITDGGHFENAGIYELLRRHVPRIVCLDCGQDERHRFVDLANLIRKARIDFNLEIRFLDTAARRALWEKIDPNLAQSLDPHFGLLAEFRNGPDKKRPHALLAAVYDSNQMPVSLILILKPSFSGDEPQDLVTYQSTQPLFPQEPTIDQFFGEAQWESYRMLGEHVADQMFLTDKPTDAPWWFLELSLQHLPEPVQTVHFCDANSSGCFI
ncbi:MAG: hypothetical protein EXS36_13025 [Pedosphaera sp.]|nr:hypothetical protein [Pedosphaera sp.]